MKNVARVSIVVFVSLFAFVSARSSGEVWRYPEKEVPATGPALVEIGQPGRDKAPRLDVVVKDDKGQPVAGMAINVFPYLGKNEPKHVATATDASGGIVVRGIDMKGLDAVRLAFIWEAGVKTIRVRVEPSKKGWAVVAAPYKRVEDGKDEGSCMNLFSIKPEGGGSFQLTFKRPPSIAWCEDIVYGSKKHEQVLSHINEIGKRDVNKGDKNMYNADDEAKMGLEASNQFDQKLPAITDPDIVGYVTQLALKIVASSDQPNLKPTVRVVNTQDVNAFVTAGGHIFVFSGLIAVAQNESQLAGVIAHETSHAIARHVTEGATRNQFAQTGAQVGSAVLGGLLKLGNTTQGLLNEGATQSAGLVTLHFDRASETEADLLGSQYLWKGGWDPEAIAHFFEMFAKMSKGSSTPEFLSTHPTDAKRVQNGITWARAFLPAKEKYLVDTAEFQACKAKVQKLPKPPKPTS
ncbi:MAG TPA: M48 family metallopeptidase [Candidatus Polarisedimenticolaceae bacterium]|nr:M48 family metallopeptidase [Candidatus Polarisedimenticolaceae bacterium]